MNVFDWAGVGEELGLTEPMIKFAQAKFGGASNPDAAKQAGLGGIGGVRSRQEAYRLNNHDGVRRILLLAARASAPWLGPLAEVETHLVRHGTLPAGAGALAVDMPVVWWTLRMDGPESDFDSEVPLGRLREYLVNHAAYIQEILAEIDGTVPRMNGVRDED